MRLAALVIEIQSRCSRKPPRRRCESTWLSEQRTRSTRDSFDISSEKTSAGTPNSMAAFWTAFMTRDVFALGVRAGETVALVGANGCGKTTLLSLLPRFYDPDHGSVLIDGYDLRTVNLRSLRRLIGMVTQDTILFDDTIYNNICYGTRGAKPADVEAAAQRAIPRSVPTP